MSKVVRYLVFALLLTTVLSESGAKEGDSAKSKSNKKSKPYKELTDESKFGKFLTEHDNALVLFYAPWCKHCKELMPTFKEVTGKLKSSGITHSARINGDKFKEVTNAYKVDGFPTLIAFKKAVPYVYKGDQSVNDIIDFVTKVASPPLKSLNTQEEFDSFVAAHPTTAIACLAPSGDDNDENDQNEYDEEEMNTVRKVFHRVASNIHMYSEIYFGIVDSPSVNTGRSPSLHPTVIFNTPGFPLREYKFNRISVEENDEKKSSQDVLARDFIRWLDIASIPILDDITNNNYMRYMNADKPIVWLVVRDLMNKEIIKWFRSVAEKYAGELLFVILDDKSYHDQSKVLGVSDIDVYPSVAISNGRKNYAMDKTEAENLNEETTNAFIKKFLDGELAKRIRSQPLPDPEENAKKSVKDIVALSFQSIALDPKKDVLVKFYASWCKHCKDLAPEYERAAELLSSVSSVTFAQIEASENDVPEALGISGYPTIILFPATPESAPIYFDGPSRSAEDIAMFVYENAATDFEMPKVLSEAIAKKEEEEKKKKKEEEEAKMKVVEEEEEDNENIEIKKEL